MTKVINGWTMDAADHLLPGQAKNKWKEEIKEGVMIWTLRGGEGSLPHGIAWWAISLHYLFG